LNTDNQDKGNQYLLTFLRIDYIVQTLGACHKLLHRCFHSLFGSII